MTEPATDPDVTSLVDRHATDRWNRVAVGDMLERHTWSRPDAEFLVGLPGAHAGEGTVRLTYRDADRLANQVAHALLGAGLTRGDRVLLVCENSVEALLTKLGTAKAGLVAVPLNPSLAPDVVAHLVGLTEPRFAVVDGELGERVAPVLAGAGRAVDVTIPVGGGPVPGSSTFAEFVAGQPTAEPDVVIHGDDIWELLFTSGTTAMPKGVMLSHTYSHLGAYSFALTLTRGLPDESDLRLLTFLPVIYHVADHPFALSVLTVGGTLVVGRRPVHEQVAEAITKERITAHWGGSPQFVKALAQILDRDPMRYDAGTLTVLMYGWGAMEPGVIATLRRRAGAQLTLIGIFGQTEAISCHRFRPDREAEKYLRTAPEVNYVGRPGPALAATVLDDDGNDLLGKPGEQGEACYRSPVVTAGYYRDEAATREAFRHGWFHSGDSCVVDEDGLRIMVDRYKDIIKSGGENVSSLRVEAVLHQHPAVAKAAVVGLPHDRWGEAVTAVVVPADAAAGPVDEAELIAFAKARLAGFEVPKKVLTTGALPETVGGKVLKYKLRRELDGTYRGTV